MPDWIKENIVKTCSSTSHKKHRDVLENAHEVPFANNPISHADFEMFKQSPYFKNHKLLRVDHFERLIMEETEDFDCTVCKRAHTKHSNHPFLVRKGDN